MAKLHLRAVEKSLERSKSKGGETTQGAAAIVPGAGEDGL